MKFMFYTQLDKLNVDNIILDIFMLSISNNFDEIIIYNATTDNERANSE